ncbi:MAG: ABC transporter permease [Pseudomonadota bacterium]|nr:ABC transporter permease [Pseudomonadota bacterium]
MTRFLVRWAPLAIVAAAWELAPRLGLVNPAALPPLSAVLAAFWQLTLSGDLLRNGAGSLWRLVCGLGLAVVVGVSLGLLMAWYIPVRVVVGPLVRCLYPLPKSALIPVLLLWFGLGDMSKIMLIFIGCLLPVLVSTFNGVRGLDPMLFWSARSMGRRPAQVLLEVALPGALPDILAGLRTALALSFILLVSSEFLMASNGLGYLISFLGDGGVYSGMFAAVLVVSLLGFAADRVFLVVMRRALAWRG